MASSEGLGAAKIPPVERKFREEKALQEKAAGNASYKAGNAVEALRRYSVAVALNPDDHLLHSNRSMALAALHRWKESEESAAMAVRHSQGFVKGYLRLAKAQMEQGKNIEAMQSCERGIAAAATFEPATVTPNSSNPPSPKSSTSSNAKALKELEKLAAAAAAAQMTKAQIAGGASGHTAATDPGGTTGSSSVAAARGRGAEGASRTTGGSGSIITGPGRRASTGAGGSSQGRGGGGAGEGEGISQRRASAGSAEGGEGGVGGGGGAKPSIKDFKVVEELGTGNFSTIVKAEHRKNGKAFALKMIEKGEVNRLRRRHVNVYNEIYMEKRALTKLKHPNIVRMHSTFQDYGTLYYLLDMCDGGEVWKRLTVRGKVVGAHPSLARFWLSEVVSAIEHMHCRGLVHRDLKPENMMLTADGHVKLVDFGTCKDLVETDLNGGEFVGTAQYMSPQAVASEDQGREADLWALGCCVFQFLAGFTPFHAPSPYLCFLRIKKGVFRCPEILPEAAVDLIKHLLRRNPSSRLGALSMDTKNLIPQDPSPPCAVGTSSRSSSSSISGVNPSLKKPLQNEQQQPQGSQGAQAGGGVGVTGRVGAGEVPGAAAAAVVEGFVTLKAHPFFGGQAFVGESEVLPPAVTVPELRELCVRAVGHHLVDFAATTPLVREPFPAHVDLRRLLRGISSSLGAAGMVDDESKRRQEETEKEGKQCMEAVRHYLLRLGLLQLPKVNRLFHSSVADAKSLKADPIMREYLGLDWDSHGHWNGPFFFLQITDPQLGLATAGAPTGGPTWEIESERLSCMVDIVNRLRPKFLLVTGDMTHDPPGNEFYEGQVASARQALAKVSETIPVLYCPGNHDLGYALGDKHDSANYVKRFGADFYSFWWGGVRGLVLNTNLWAIATANPERRVAQERWLEQELGVANLNAHHLVVIGHHPWFLRDPLEEEHPMWTPIPRETRLRWLSKMARCKVKFIISGHCHRNYEARMRRHLSIPTTTTTTTTTTATTDSSPIESPKTSPLASGEAATTAASDEMDIPTSDAGGISSDGDGSGGGALDVSSMSVEEEGGETREGVDSRVIEEVESNEDPGQVSDGEEDDQTVEGVDLQSVVTSSCTAPLGPDPPGFRVFRVYSRRLEHEYFALDSPPAEVKLEVDDD